jgi:hypothetical protein
MGERAVKIALAGCVLGAAGVVTWAVTNLRDGNRPSRAGPVAAPEEPRGGDLTGPRRPASRPGRAAAARTRRPAGRPLGAPQVMPPARPVFSTSTPAPPAPSQRDQPPRRNEEVAARRVLEPLVARRASAEMPFVRCLDPGGWKQEAASREEEAAAGATGEGQDPLAVPSRDPTQAICRARLRARDAATLTDLLREASGAYQGHLVTTDPREHLDAYLGRWFEIDVQLDTEEPYPLPPP